MFDDYGSFRKFFVQSKLIKMLGKNYIKCVLLKFRLIKNIWSTMIHC